MAKRIKIGDIIEIPVKDGFAYAQYVHKHAKPPHYGSMLLVFPQINKEQLKDFSELLTQKRHYFIFFPLQTAVSRGIFKIVTHLDVLEYAVNFPIFKVGVPNKDGRVETWWLWDGEKEWKVESLTSEQKKFSNRALWNDTMLIEKIENGWSPEDKNKSEQYVLDPSNN